MEKFKKKKEKLVEYIVKCCKSKEFKGCSNGKNKKNNILTRSKTISIPSNSRYNRNSITSSSASRKNSLFRKINSMRSSKYTIETTKINLIDSLN